VRRSIQREALRFAQDDTGFLLARAFISHHTPPKAFCSPNTGAQAFQLHNLAVIHKQAHRRHTGLAHYLEKRSIKEIYLIGIALDYCIEYSELDACHLSLNTHVILDGCRGIELEPGDIGRALDEMKRAGPVLLKSSDL
jgi:nicotinamidase-related amidase